MPKAPSTVHDIIKSQRFKNATQNRIYNEAEIQKIQELLDYVEIKNLSKKYKQITTLVSHDLNDLIDRYNWLQNNKTRTSKQSWIIRYGPELGEIKYQEYGEKQRRSNSFEYKQEKFGWTKEQFDEYNKSRSITLEKCILRHGEVKGKDQWNHYVERQRYTNSLEYFKEKYQAEGHNKWLAYNQDKAKSSRVDWVMEKYQVTFDEAVEIIASRSNRGFASIAEQLFVDLFEQHLGSEVPYSCKTKQFCIWNVNLDGPCFYDVVDSSRNKIIEFHGDYWHCNPKKYSSSYVVSQNGMTAKEVWERDHLKRKAALDRGFEVKVVWESEFENNWQKVIEDCVTWWNLPSQQ